VSELIADAAVSVYTPGGSGRGKHFGFPRATVGDAKLHNEGDSRGVRAAGNCVLARTRQSTGRLRQFKREDYPHIDIRKSLLSLTYLPLIHNENLIGALEILAFEEEISGGGGGGRCLPVAEVAAAARSQTAQAYEEERHATMTSITRLTQLYDLEKVFFQSTLGDGRVAAADRNQDFGKFWNARR